MTDLVPADQIEQIVGARRHPLAHLGRAVSAEQTVYILHSQRCKGDGPEDIEHLPSELRQPPGQTGGDR